MFNEECWEFRRRRREKKTQQNRPVADSCWCIWSQLKDNRNEIQPVKQGKDLAIEFWIMLENFGSKKQW